MRIIDSATYRNAAEGELGVSIGNADPSLYRGTYYRFRLGSVAGTGDEVRLVDEPLTLAPGESLLIWSLETFSLGHGVMGFVGSSTDLIERRLRLEYSPFVDPGYPGYDGRAPLRLALGNTGREPAEITPASQLGKVAFVELERAEHPHAGQLDPLEQAKWQGRRDAGWELERAYREGYEAMARRHPELAYLLPLPQDED